MKSSERAGLVRPDGNHVIMAIFVELSDAGREKEQFYAGDSGVTAHPLSGVPGGDDYYIRGEAAEMRLGYGWCW